MSQPFPHKDQPRAFIHFTGRPRKWDDKPPAVVPQSGEERLVRILETGRILAFSSYGSPPVVCISESTRGAVAGMVTKGVTERGPYEPWGLLLKRDETIKAGFRPVLNLTRDEQELIKSVDGVGPKLRGLFVTYDRAANVDWLTEREWRYVTTPGGHLDLTGLVLGVAVPRKGWEPPAGRKYAAACRTLARFYLDTNGKEPAFVREDTDLSL